MRTALRNDATRERAAALADRARDLAVENFYRLQDLSRNELIPVALRLSEQVRDRALELAREGTERVADLDVVERLPEPVQKRLGRKRHRSRLPAVLLVLAGAAIVAGGLAFIWQRYIALPDEDEDEDEFEEPLAYPAAGSGTGWPEPQRTAEHTEPPGAVHDSDAGRGVHNGGNGGSAPAGGRGVPPIQMASGNMPPPGTGTQQSSGGAPRNESTGDTRASGVMTPTLESPRPVGLGESGAGAPAAASEPAQRPPLPFTQDQAENNARLQLMQNDLYVALPGLTRHDIVQSDGDLDRLANAYATRSAMDAAVVRERIGAILAAGPDAEAQD